MSSTLSLCWNLLATIGNLPDELIVKILYEYNGLKHPIVKLLYNETKIDKYERLKNVPFSKNIQKHYYKYGLNDNLIYIMNHKQKYYKLHFLTSYINWNDPGYFIRREKGRLYYNVLNDRLNVIKTSYMNLWKLERSKKIIENIKCRCSKRFVNDFGSLNYLDILYNKHSDYVTILNEIEIHYNINHWICNQCYNIAFNHWKPDISNI